MSEVEKVMEGSNLPAQTTTEPIFWYTDSGKVQNKLSADKLDRFVGDSTYTVFTGHVKLVFYNDTGSVDGTLTSQKGFIYGNHQGIMEARDSVRFKNSAGDILRTERLIWNRDSAKVYTNSQVTIQRKDAVIYGKGLVSDQNFSHYRILHPSGNLYLNKEKQR